MEKTAPLKRLFKRVELHPFRPEDYAADNPFIAVIENTGKPIALGVDTL